MSNLKQYVVIGRAAPTEKAPVPQIYRMRLFAKHDVGARSQFWNHLRRNKRIKRHDGEMLSCKLVPDQNPNQVKNFAIWVKYRSNKGVHNLLLQYRGTLVSDVVQRMYNELAGQYRARPDNVQIIGITTRPASKVTSKRLQPYIQSHVAFPLPNKKPRSNKIFQAKALNRPL